MDEELARQAAETTRRWVLRARGRLARSRSRLDALNVFPVPDGDTGTNMLHTLDAGLAAVRAAGPTLVEQAAAISRGTLLGARGNSGVILSQLVRGATEAVAAGQVFDGRTIADGFARADALAWAAVTRPTEGTILTVSQAAAAAARQAARTSASPVAVVDAALVAARTALAETEHLLPVLTRAGVVDAGGAGYVVLLEALGDTLHGRPGLVEEVSVVVAGAQPRVLAGPAFEVMYLLSPTPSSQVLAGLREELAGIGDSVVVAPGPHETQVHVHTDDVGSATAAGMSLGQISGLRVTNLRDDEPLEEHPAPSADGERSHLLGVVACAEGPGLEELFASAGAVPVTSVAGRRATTGDLLEAARSCGSPHVLLLPNDGDAHLAADQAARAAVAEGFNIHVVPTTSAVQGIAAVAVLDPAQEPAAAIEALTEAARGTRSGAVTIATRRAETAVGPCVPGQAVGIVEGGIIALGDDLAEITATVVQRLCEPGAELVTLVLGQERILGLEDAASWAAGELEMTVIDGAQPVYPLLIGVE